MDGVRMMTVQIALDSRTIGGNEMLIPFEDTRLADHTCRQFLSHVLDTHLERPEVLATVDNVRLFCV